MGFTAENATEAMRLFRALDIARKETDLVGDGRTVEGVYISRGFGSDGVEIGRHNLLFPEMLDILIRANKARVHHIETKLRDLGAEVAE